MPVWPSPRRLADRRPAESLGRAARDQAETELRKAPRTMPTAHRAHGATSGVLFRDWSSARPVGADARTRLSGAAISTPPCRRPESPPGRTTRDCRDQRAGEQSHGQGLHGTGSAGARRQTRERSPRLGDRPRTPGGGGAAGRRTGEPVATEWSADGRCGPVSCGRAHSKRPDPTSQPVHPATDRTLCRATRPSGIRKAPGTILSLDRPATAATERCARCVYRSTSSIRIRLLIRPFDS